MCPFVKAGCVATSLRLAAATLSAEAQRRLTVLAIEITTGYRWPDGQWPLRCPVAWPVAEFNARVASDVDAPDPHDRRLGPDQFATTGLPRASCGWPYSCSRAAVVAAVSMVPAESLGALGLKPHRQRVKRNARGVI